MRIPIQFKSNEDLILGIFHVANHQLDIPIVLVMCYGMNGNRVIQHRMAVKLGESLEKKGVNLVRFDYRNVGVSDGSFEKTSIKERIDDTLNVCKYVKACFYDKKIKIVLIGFSDGARNVLNIAENKIVDGIILWNPIFNIISGNNKVNTNMNSRKLSLHPLYRKPIKKLLGVAINLELIREIEAENVIEIFEKIDKQVLVIFGEDDELTKDIRKYLFYKGLMDKKNISSFIIKKANHLFNESEQVEEVFEVTIEWIMSNIKCL